MSATSAGPTTAAPGRSAGVDNALQRFTELYDFTLDEFQVRACAALQAGGSVLVAAPTGAGKTVVGEFAVHLALANGTKCFYTTPIKALSNQKYADLVRRYGASSVGLLTGDNSVNGEAPIVVMTTEVLRNMLYAGSTTLSGLSHVVMDEVHYLADRSRGAVWEEVLIHLPEHVQVSSLSATVSNAEEFGEWLATVRGGCDVVLEERRPVPLWQHVMVGSRLLDLFVDDGQKRVNPELTRLAREEQRLGKHPDARAHPGARRGGSRRRGSDTPSRVEVISRLESAGLLPAITFVFSRAGCDAAVQQCLNAGVRLTTAPERLQIREFVRVGLADIPEEDLHLLGFDSWQAGLMAGVAAHHAGMLPAFKEVVESLFSRGLIRAVFATETLALGINMPARSVVLERLVKFNGESHADITPAEYTQLTGRAGRRGIDVEGHAVVLWQPGLQPLAVAGLASTRTYPLRSSFRPSYNMAVNLVGRLGRQRARSVLESSFAQFQADRAVVGMNRQIRRNREGQEGYREALQCHLGDFEEYAHLRQLLSARERELAHQSGASRRAAAAAAFANLQVGDVIYVPSGRSEGLAVVLDRPLTGARDGVLQVTVLTQGQSVRRLSALDVGAARAQPGDRGAATEGAPAALALGRVRIPRSFRPKVPASRRELAELMRSAVPEQAMPRRGHGGRARARTEAADDAQLARMRAALRRHPCHGCDEREEHARWAERLVRLQGETEQLQQRVDGRTNTVAKQFDRVCALLDQLGYLDEDNVTQPGRQLAGIYAELDLLAAECLRRGLWEHLAPAELAACVAALTYESRGADEAPVPRGLPPVVSETLASMVRLWAELDDVEDRHRLDFLREPDLGFCHVAWRWAAGHRLEHVLSEADLSAGDFVRAIKQLLDLLDQVAEMAGDSPLQQTALDASRQLRRGVVAYSSL